jgi:3-dehydroquinate synthetase
MHSSLKHGFAVASGMEIATDFSFERGNIGFDEKERIINLLKRFKLLDKHDLTDEQMVKLVTHDKKKTGNEIHFVFTHGIGKAEVEKVPVSDVLGFYKRFRDK